ncbi:MAG: hemolysin D [Proteobacteria bacterium]|nr:MAG: hemolysin D [Pseudomonadota bacterium]
MDERTRRIVYLLVLGALALAHPFVPTVPWPDADAPARADDDGRQWRAVAPGRVEPSSGEIKIRASVVGAITEVVVKANDTVIAGEPLIRLADQEALARVASARAQLDVRKRARNDERTWGRAAERRRAEDAVADAQRDVENARATLDRVALERRAGSRSDADVAAARAAVSRAQDELTQRKAALRRAETEPNAPLPSPTDGEYSMARAELMAATAALDKMTIRAPRDGTVLQVNAKAGELAAPSATAPLIVLGEISAKRVRAELDARDYGSIKLGQPAVVRTAAFPGRDFTGTVSSIAPIAEPARIGSAGEQRPADIEVVNVLVDLTEDATALAVGMKVDVYFRPDGMPRSSGTASLRGKSF